MSNIPNGFEIIDDLLSQHQISSINKELGSVNLPISTGGIRNAEKKFSFVKELIASNTLIDSVKQYLNGESKLVRAILFDKTSENNWLVTWHQDRTVAVSEKFDDPKWGPWSIKDGVHHVQPPLAVLNKMITFRIHMDDTDEQNGCLKVIPKSQEMGILSHEQIQQYVEKHPAVVCPAKAGSALVMRPHILHASSKASKPSRRRVLHIEYCNYKLPGGIEWA